MKSKTKTRGALALALTISCVHVVLSASQATLAMPAGQIDHIVQTLDDRSAVLSPIARAVAYTETKEFKDNFEEACKTGKKAIDDALAAKKGKSLAVVSDLDETLLDNRPYFNSIGDLNEGQINWASFEEWQKTCQAKPLDATRELLNYARSKGVAVFFVTGRMERLRKTTIENLLKYGIAYDGLYMRANGDEQKAATMKKAYRKQIEDMGFEIVVNIGDQYSDLAGGYGQDCEKLPNKIYLIR